MCLQTSIHPKGDQSWVFTGRTDAEAETPVLWPPHAKSWLFGKDNDAGRDWGQEEKGTTEDEMTGWHHWLDGHESAQTPGVCDGQGGLACCDSWGRKESDTTERLNWLNWLTDRPLSTLDIPYDPFSVIWDAVLWPGCFNVQPHSDVGCYHQGTVWYDSIHCSKSYRHRRSKQTKISYILLLNTV